MKQLDEMELILLINLVEKQKQEEERQDIKDALDYTKNKLKAMKKELQEEQLYITKVCGGC